jgi:plasmid stabilization system protein ParE
MKLRFTPRAVQNIVQISDYLRERNPKAALRVRAAIYHGLDNLLLFADAGRMQSVEGIRKLVTAKYAYLIYYRVDRAHDEIVILSVKHPAQAREYEDG